MKKYAISLLVLFAMCAASCGRTESRQEAELPLTAVVVPTPHVLVSTGCGDCEATELWVMNRETKRCELVLRGRYDDDLMKTIACINHPVFSLDQKSIYYVSAAFATSGAIHRVDLKTKEDVFVIDGGSVDVIPDGKYKGLLLVDRALIKFDQNGETMGRNDYLWLVFADGKPFFEIGQSEGADAVRFRAENLKKTRE